MYITWPVKNKKRVVYYRQFVACFHIFGSPNVNVLLKETNFHPLQQRKSDGEHESSRRLKTQFLIEMEGFDSGSEQILLIGKRNWNMHV